jgi:hypothetical protein
MSTGAPLVATAATHDAGGMVIGLRSAGGIIGAGMLAVVCALAVGCGSVSSGAPRAGVVAVRHKARSHRFCVDEVTEPTAAELAKINRYWTPLARSALTTVSKGKMTVTVPKKHLTRAQRRALNLAYWAERKFSPKPKVVCERVPTGGIPSSAPTVAPQRSGSPGS